MIGCEYANMIAPTPASQPTAAIIVSFDYGVI
jgi:hypothetical protein